MVVCLKGKDISIQAVIKVELINGQPIIEFLIQPHLIFQNRLKVIVLFQNYSESAFSDKNGHGGKNKVKEIVQYVHRLDPLEDLHFLSPGKSINLSFQYTDGPITGILPNLFKGGCIPISMGKD